MARVDDIEGSGRDDAILHKRVGECNRCGREKLTCLLGV